MIETGGPFRAAASREPESGRRRTRQKAEVREALANHSGFVSAQQLHAELAQAGSRIGLATVYRALNELTGSGTVDVLKSPTGATLYRGCLSGEHHHHLVCRACGKTVEVHFDAVEEWARSAAAQNGFSDVGHILDIFGTCEECFDADSHSGRSSS